MAGQRSDISILTNQRGKIRAAGGAEIEVTFSLYPKRGTHQGVSEHPFDRGCCRVSDGSDVLLGIFEAGLPVMLVSAYVQAEIRLISPYSFQIAGIVVETGVEVERGDVPGGYDRGGRVSAQGQVRQRGPFWRSAAGTLSWELGRLSRSADFGIRPALCGARKRDRSGQAE